MLELDIGVCGRKKVCMRAGISGGGPPWAHEAGGAPSTLVGIWWDPPDVFSVPIILKYSGKNYIKFSGHLENFYFRGIFVLHR